jgi:acyl-CoA thioester hydrolase
MATDLVWDLPEPFCIELEVDSSHIDRLGHANHSVYLQWCEQCAWEHAESVDAGWALWNSLDRAMAVLAAHLEYLRPAFEKDQLIIGNWVIVNDQRLRATRQFQIIRPADGETLLRAKLNYVCIGISSGRPKRIPKEFIAAYRVLPSVGQALKEAASLG